ncbi:MAG: sugar phosphate isomerase/epimerase [Victivallales bacterium]|jgi:sugar phosphate isomerase/epimerase|nr:sugar phosphate isomerase/epimerase [Victivallales bacterium]
MNFPLSYQINTVCWDGKRICANDEKSINQALERLKSCGINEVMLSGYHEEKPSDFDLNAETVRIGKKLSAYGMKAAQHHGVLPTFAPLGENQSEVVNRIIRQLEFTANLNADVLVVHPGRIAGHHADVASTNAMFQKEVEKHGVDEVIKVSAENLHLAGLAAEKLNVKFALENIDGVEPLADIDTLPRLIRAADSDSIGFCLDSGHAHRAGVSPVTWLEKLGDKLLTTHFHDNRGSRDEHMPPGFGTIPWIDVIQSLKEIGYKHTVNFESGPWPGMEARQGYCCAIQFWRSCEYLAESKA